MEAHRGSDPFRLVGTTVDGKYRVDRVLGEGASGVVYAGFHLVLAQPVAIKFLKPTAGRVDEQRRGADAFMREARVLFGLAHPAIVRLYDVGILASDYLATPYVVLELVNGPTLEEEIARRAPTGLFFSAQELLTIFEPVLEAMAFAHEHSVLHRDLKPSNVMLTWSPSGQLVGKVVDFGVARSAAMMTAASAGPSGFTPRYAAPEQWDASLGPPSPVTDVFALGLTIAEASTLAPALRGDTPAQLFAAAMNAARGVASVSNVRRDLSPAVDAIVQRATRLAQHERFGSAREMLGALRAALGPQPHGSYAPVAALAPSPQTAQVAPAARSRSVLVAVLLVALLALGSAVALVAVMVLRSDGDDPPATPAPVVEVARATPSGAAPPSGPESAAKRGGPTTTTTTTTTRPRPSASPVVPTATVIPSVTPPVTPPVAPPVTPPVAPSVTPPASANVRIARVLFPEPSYTEAQALAALNARMPDLVACYAVALKREPSLNGELTLWVQTDGKGAITDLNFANLNSGDFEGCVRQRAKQWRFPATKGGGEARPQYRIVLSQ